MRFSRPFVVVTSIDEGETEITTEKGTGTRTGRAKKRMTQESQEMEAEEDTEHENASLYRLEGPNWTMAGGDDDDEYYLEELEESRAKQFGPAAKKGRSKKLSRVFRYREEKLERLERVVELTTEVYNEAIGRIGDGAASLERLHLLDRRNKILDKVEAQVLCDVVMAAIDERMQEAGFEGLERPLVELEVLHVRKLIGAELWCPKWFVEGKPIINPVKDILYYILYRRNYNVVMKMGKIVIHTYAAAYGLRNIFIRPSTVEYLEMAMKLRNRTKRGILILEKSGDQGTGGTKGSPGDDFDTTGRRRPVKPDGRQLGAVAEEFCRDKHPSSDCNGSAAVEEDVGELQEQDDTVRIGRTKTQERPSSERVPESDGGSC